MLARHIADQRHHYKEVVADTALPYQSVCLGKEAFQASQTKCSVPLETLATTKQKTDWYCSTATDIGRHHVDLEVARELLRSGGHADLEALFLSRLINFKHKILVTQGERGEWFLAGANWDDSSALVWPAISVTIRGREDTYAFTPSFRDGSDFRLITIMALDGWFAVPYRWRSPWWQHANLPGARQTLLPEVMAIATEPVRPLAQVAARAGYWSLARVSCASCQTCGGCSFRRTPRCARP